MTKIPLTPQNKHSTLEIIENVLNLPKLSQNTVEFLDFKGILVSFKLLLILVDFRAFFSI